MCIDFVACNRYKKVNGLQAYHPGYISVCTLCVVQNYLTGIRILRHGHRVNDHTSATSSTAATNKQRRY